MLAALRKKATSEHERVNCGGAFTLGTTRFRCWRDTGHGGLIGVEAIMKSCDVYFYTMGNRIGLDAIASVGFDLDGFPRNTAQADTLGQLLVEIGKPLQAVVLMQVDTGALFKRLTGRRTCRVCGAVFNVHTNPPVPGAAGTPCAQGHDLVQRADDNEATIGKRLEVYEHQGAGQ